MLIDAGASLGPAVKLMGMMHRYQYENFDPSVSRPALITLWKAQHRIHQVLEQCQKHNHFDFGEFFDGKNKDIESVLTENAVQQASSELLPFYHAYALRWCPTKHLESHRSFLLGGHQ